VIQLKDYKNIQGNYYDNAHSKNAHKSQSFMYNTREDYFIEFMELKGTENILDIGCGSGTFVKRLAQKYKKAKFCGADASEAVIKFANKTNTKKNLRFVSAPIEKLPFKDNSFDSVIVSHLIEHIKEPKKALKEVKRVLKKKGILFLTTPNYFSLWPLAEIVFDKTIANDGYSLDEQHISRFTHFSIKKSIRAAGFDIAKAKSLYIFSLEASVISAKLGNALFKVDKLLDFLPLGMITYVKAIK
jgi:ubiquinone/menaquinone biosynthesis C-methylase UbiE